MTNRIAVFCFTATLVLGSVIFGMNATLAQDSLEIDYKDELPRIPAIPAQKTRESFEILKGYDIRLVASEPLVQDPISIAFDESGRAYVVEMRGYSEHGDESLGVIRLLEDLNGDGVFDKSTPFVEGLSWPTAICCYDGGVLIGVAPDIIYCKDTDGDRRADINEVWFSGFGRGNVQGLINSFRWGLDNRIYGSAGVNGGSIKMTAKPDAAPIDMRGRNFVIDPKTKTITAIEGGGQHGMTFDAWGTRYTCSNSDHLQQFIFENRYLSRNPFVVAPSPRISIASDGAAAPVYRISDVEPWRIVRTRLRVQALVRGPVEGGGRASGYFTSATGVTIYQGDAIPELDGQAWIGDVGSNLIHRKQISGDDIAKKADRIDKETEFLRSKDIWFRPVQFANAPDGSLYVIDMYRETIEHPLSLPELIKKHLDLDSGRDRGRLYCIVPVGFKHPIRKMPAEASTPELVAMLGHTNGWHRETAARLLFEQAPESSLLTLRNLVSNDSNKAIHPQARIRALYLLAESDAAFDTALLAALKDAHPAVRRHAIRLAESFPTEAIQQQLLSLADDPDINVRYQLAFTLGQLENEQAKIALSQLAKRDAENPRIRLAVMSSLSTGKAIVIDELLKDAEFCRSPAGVQLLSTLLEQIARQREPADIKRVALVLKSHQDSPENFGALLLAVVNGAGGNFDGVKKLLDAAGEFSLDKMTAEMVQSSLQQAADEKLDANKRISAINLLRLAEQKDFAQVFQSTFDFDQPPSIQQALLQIASGVNEDTIAKTILPKLQSLSPTTRGQAMNILFSRLPWVELTLQALEQKQIDSHVLSAANRQTLLQHADADIRERASKILQFNDLAREKVIEDYRQVLKMAGDPEKGRTLFRDKCSACHQLEKYGTSIGPNLAAFVNRGAEAILLNVLDPNREVDAQYIAYIIELVDGRSLSGIIAGESATSVSLRDNQGKPHTILRKDIESISSTAFSLMPQNLENDVSKQAMADLIAYLSAMRQ